MLIYMLSKFSGTTSRPKVVCISPNSEHTSSRILTKDIGAFDTPKPYTDNEYVDSRLKTFNSPYPMHTYTSKSQKT